MEMISTFRNLQNSNVKLVKKDIGKKKCICKCDKGGKNFTHNIGSKGHITAVHERKDSIVINVAKMLL